MENQDYQDAHMAEQVLLDRKWAIRYSLNKVFGTPEPRTWKLIFMPSKNTIVPMTLVPRKVLGKDFPWCVRATFKFKNNDFPVVVVKDDNTWYGYHDRPNVHKILGDTTIEGLADKIDADLKAVKVEVNDDQKAIAKRISEDVALIKSKFGEEFEVDTKNGWRSEYFIAVQGTRHWLKLTIMGKTGETAKYIQVNCFSEAMELDDVMVSHLAEVLKRSALKEKMSAVE